MCEPTEPRGRGNDQGPDHQPEPEESGMLDDPVGES